MTSTPQLGSPQSSYPNSPRLIHRSSTVSLLSEDYLQSFENVPIGRNKTHDIATAAPARNRLRKSPPTSAGYRPVTGEDGAIPQPEPPRRNLALSVIITDCAAVLMPLAMVLFVYMVWRLDGSQVVDDSHSSWQNAITVLATVFPILFASVVGRLMTEAARWRLENGSTVGALEQLLGSRTVGGTALTMIRFRSFSILTILLLALWMFSPLGTQALLRMTTLRVGSVYRDAQVTYFDTNSGTHFPEWRLNSAPIGLLWAAKIRPLGSLYTALVTTPEHIKKDAMDLWGNVRIPMLDDFEEQDWRNVSLDADDIQYSSLVGVPVGHIHDGISGFSLESTYIQLECSNVTMAPGFDEVSPQFSGLNEAATVVSGTHIYNEKYRMDNGTWHGFPTSRGRGIVSGFEKATWSLALDRFVDPIWMKNNNTWWSAVHESLKTDRSHELHRPILFDKEAGVEAGPTTLLFQGFCQRPDRFDVETDLSVKSTCRVKQKYVESRVRCSSASRSRKNCTVTAQRPSQKRHPPEDISFLSFPMNFLGITQDMPLTIGAPVSYQTETSLYYLKDPTLKNLQSEEHDFLRDVTEAGISVRLAQLINTYIQLGQLYLKVTEGSNVDATFEPNITVTATRSTDMAIFRVKRIWAMLCLASGGVLLGAGILGVFFKHWARGPEILGYASLMVRDSKYIDAPSDSGWLDGNELSSRMRKQRVRFGVVDVKDGKESLVGVGLEDETERIDRRLRRSRSGL